MIEAVAQQSREHGMGIKKRHKLIMLKISLYVVLLVMGASSTINNLNPDSNSTFSQVYKNIFLVSTGYKAPAGLDNQLKHPMFME